MNGMNRALLVLAVVLSSPAGSPLVAAEAHRGPNVLLIVSDDQGYPDLGCIGTKPILTPSLDRLAAEGVRATSFYVTWPACTPSRGSLLTGRYPQRNGLYDMVRNDLVNYGHRYSQDEYAVSPEMTRGLDVREVTLGDLFRGAGYATGMVGKWDMGQARRFLPLQRGFDFFYGIGNNGIDYYTHERYGIPSMFRGNERTQEDRGIYVTELFEREALGFIRRNRSRPFFLYVAFTAPHVASSLEKPGVQAPEDDVRKYESLEIPERQKSFFAAVTRMDEAIGKMLELVGELGLERDTVVVFFSDNGGSGNGGNAPLRGSKSTLWEGGLRVPFIAKWPGRIPRGTVTDQWITSLDLFPTFAAIADAPPPRDLALDGYDMLPVLQGKGDSRWAEMFWERRDHRAARVGPWKWIESSRGGGLFDLRSDLGEREDLSESHPEVLRRVQARFAAWKAAMAASPPRGPFRDY